MIEVQKFRRLLASGRPQDRDTALSQLVGAGLARVTLDEQDNPVPHFSDFENPCVQLFRETRVRLRA